MELNFPRLTTLFLIARTTPVIVPSKEQTKFVVDQDRITTKLSELVAQLTERNRVSRIPF